MSEEIKGFLATMASEMSDLGGTGRESAARARRAALVTLACIALMVSGIGAVAYTAITSVSLPRPGSPAHRTPTPKANGLIAFAGRVPGDGRRFDNGGSALYTMRPDGSGVSLLVERRSGIWDPVWSPDGTRIAFVGVKGGHRHIFVADADGKGLRAITKGLEDDQTPVWSPDGTRILFARVLSPGGRGETGPHLYIVSVAGGPPRPLVTSASFGGEQDPVWSPDGAEIAFFAVRGLGAGIYEVHPDGSALRLLDREANYPYVIGVPHSWSPDGSAILMSGTGGPFGFSLGLLDLAGKGGPDVFHCVCQLLGRPSWSPDGSEVIFAVRSPQRLVVIRPDGSGRRNIVTHVRGSCCPTWQPVSAGATITPPPSPPPFADGDPCPHASYPDVPSGAGCLTVAAGDFDGDGVTDRFLVYAYPLDANRMPLGWHLVSILSGSGVRDAGVVSGSHEPTPLRALGAVDLNGDGRDEVLVRGAAITTRVTYFAAVYLFKAGAWRLAEYADGHTRLALAAGGTAMTGVGGRCVGSGSKRWLVLDDIFTRGGAFHWTERWYRWEESDVRLDHVRHGSIALEGGTSPKAFWQFRCDGLKLT